MTDAVSKSLFERAQKTLVGGVNSPVRAFGPVGGDPVFIKEARGCTIVGADGTEYVDYVGSWGPMILGHAHPEVVAAIQQAAVKGSSYGAPTEAEIEMGELIAELVPNMEMSRLVSSGTEATMGALRLARGYTGRDVIVKCEGGYHGGADYLLVKAGSGAATLGEPNSAGVPAAIASTTAILGYNDVEGTRAMLRERGSEIAAVIIEPVAGNMGCVAPDPAWLACLREECTKAGTLLIFDEVMTGFRVALGGAQARYAVTPDLTCLGKIVGGGLPVGAYGGPREIMSKVAPLGPVYQAGTLSGNPLAVAAGLTTLKLLRADGVYDRLEAISVSLTDAIVAAAKEAGLTAHRVDDPHSEAARAITGADVVVQRVGAMITTFFSDGVVRGWGQADKCSRARFAAWHGALLKAGVYWPPSQFESAFPSVAHDQAALAKTQKAMVAAFTAARSIAAG